MMASTPSDYNTPGIAPSPLASGSGSGSGKPARILACVLCQHRKIKCDRTFPCSNCVKASATCTPSTPAPARKRRRPNQDLQERLARCEELLKAYATAKPDVEDSSMLHGGQTFSCGDPTAYKPTGRLVEEEEVGVHFVDSFMLGSIHEELRAMREIIDNEDTEDATPDTTVTHDDNSGMLLCDVGIPPSNPQPSINDLMPPPALIFKLWQVYLERVNPITKIIHVPTLQPYVAEATSGGHNVPLNIKTLLFSIYTLATVALTKDECLNLLGYSRAVALERFSEGVRQSLIRVGFLKSYDLETLRALVIFLISLQGRYNRHSTWILNGVVLRIAMKMGLHRDGEVLGLSPFETEMRRRLWWQIMLLDAKYALMSGLSHSMLPVAWDTREPCNVNDADLFPSATEPVQSREGPTEMIMVLITNRFARFLLETPGLEPFYLLAGASSINEAGGPNAEQIAKYRMMISSLGQNLLEIIDKNCDASAGPLHEMALGIKADIIDKLQALLLPPEKQVGWDEVTTPADSVFCIAVKALEHENSQHLQTRDKGFAWFSRMEFQVNIFMFVVGQLYSRRSGTLVELAWENVQLAYENYDDLFDVSNRSHYQVASYLLKAWKVRKEVLRKRQGGYLLETPDYIVKLQNSLPPQDDIKSEESSQTRLKVPTPMTCSTNSSTSPMDTGRTPASTSNPTSTFDQFLEQPFFDANSIDWNMWGSIMPTESIVSTFDSFGLPTMNNVPNLPQDMQHSQFVPNGLIQGNSIANGQPGTDWR